MHYHHIEDEVDLVPFCSDSCHRDWCARNGAEYAGWFGCQEGGDSAEYCANCGTVCNVGHDGCDCQRDNVVVNRFASTDGVKCEHGNWIQLPSRDKE